MTILFVDGWLGPDPGDWQELWTREYPRSLRVEQDDWQHAERNKWVARLDEAIAACAEPPVLIAHSLGCPTVAHWVSDNPHRTVRAALMVTPADIERNVIPEITGFDPIPQMPFPFPTIVAASRNDHWMTLDRAAPFAKTWNARLADAGEVGHLTIGEGYGPWPEGEQLLADLVNATQPK